MNPDTRQPAQDETEGAVVWVWPRKVLTWRPTRLILDDIHQSYPAKIKKIHENIKTQRKKSGFFMFLSIEQHRTVLFSSAGRLKPSGR